MYTIVSASVLALDLARHPNGAVVADVVDRALALDHLDPYPSDDGRAVARTRLLALAGDALSVGEALGSVTAAASAGLEPGPVAAASRALQSALLGRLDGLLALVERELRDERRLPREAVDVVLDRVVAAWTDVEGGADDVQALRAPWDDVLGDVPPPAPPATARTQVLALLEDVARCDERRWRGLDVAHEHQHRGTSWSDLVHEASRVAWETGRTLDTARWQLSSVRAAHAAGHVTTTCAPGAMMSVVAAVQALCAGAEVSADVRDALLGPCRAVGLGLH